MPIDIQNEYPEFTVTDTLHQLVDRLNDLTTVMSSNSTLFDSSVNDLLFMVSRDSGQYTADSDLTIISDHDLTLQGNKFRAEAGTVQLVSTGVTEVGGTGAILLSSDQNAGNVLLRSEGSTFASFRNNNSNLQITTGPSLTSAISFTNTDAEFSGTITMPSTGDGSPYTVAKTVSGAINELHEELVQITDVELERIVSLESLTSQHSDTLSSHTISLSNHDTRVSTLEALNIANRLNTLESKVSNIEVRLGLLGV